MPLILACIVKFSLNQSINYTYCNVTLFAGLIAYGWICFCVTCEYLPGPQRCPVTLVPICVLYDCNSLFFLGEALLISIHTHFYQAHMDQFGLLIACKKKYYQNLHCISINTLGGMASTFPCFTLIIFLCLRSLLIISKYGRGFFCARAVIMTG